MKEINEQKDKIIAQKPNRQEKQNESKLTSEIKKSNNWKRKNDEFKLLKNEPEDIINIKNLNKYYISGGKITKVLSDITLSIKRGEFIVLFGKSGSGKTTLLNLISGLDRPTNGQLVVCDQNLPYLSNTQLTTFRREKLAFIFQSYNLLNNLNGYDNVDTGSYLQKDKTKKMDIKQMFKDFDLSEVMDKYPSQMSGGQQQRISILRALAKNSEIIFADEPTGALDKKTSKIVLELLQKINRELGKTIIMVSHDPDVTQYSTRVIKLSKSKIILNQLKEEFVLPNLEKTNLNIPNNTVEIESIEIDSNPDFSIYDTKNNLEILNEKNEEQINTSEYSTRTDFDLLDK